MRTRVLFLNRSYWPDVEASGQLLTELCEDLTGQFDVHVIAGQPNQNPDGTSFRRRGVEVRHGVTVHRVWHTQFRKTWLVGRALNLLTFLVSATVAALLMPKPDIVVTQSDPFLLSIVGRWLKRLRGAKFIAHLQDMYPDVAIALGKVCEGWLTRLVRSQLAKAHRTADRVIVLGEPMQRLVREAGVNESRITILPNWADTEQIRPVRPAGLNERFVVMYSGNHGLSQRLDQILDTAVLLRDRNDIEFVFVGDGASKPQLVARAEAEQLTNVRFRPYVPKAQLAESLSSADVHLLPLDPRVEHCLAPCKIYGILASGTPVIAVVNEESLVGTLVREHDVGLVVPPESPTRLAEAVRRLAKNRDLASDMGVRARALAVAEFDRRQSTARFAELLNSLRETPRPVEVTT